VHLVIMFLNYDSETVTNADSCLVDWLQGWRGGRDAIRNYCTGIALVSWCMWLHRNDIVFEGAAPSSGGSQQDLRRDGAVEGGQVV
jgi:hypothetical protein